MANLKTRLEILEASVPVVQENRFIFTAIAGRDDWDIIAYEYSGLKILRLTDEALDDLKGRASKFFAESKPEQSNFCIRSIYNLST